MKQSQAVELLDERLRTHFAPAWPLVPYALNNENFKPHQKPFARFIVANVVPECRSMGPVGKRRFEYRAQFVAQVFGETNKGTLELDTLVDSIRSMFQCLHLGVVGDPMWTKAASATPVQQREGLAMLVLTLPVLWFNIE